MGERKGSMEDMVSRSRRVLVAYSRAVASGRTVRLPEYGKRRAILSHVFKWEMINSPSED